MDVETARRPGSRQNKGNGPLSRTLRGLLTLTLGVLLSLATLGILGHSPVQAQDDALEVHGFFLGAYTTRITGQGVDRTPEYPRLEERLRLNLTLWPWEAEAEARVRVEALRDGVDQTTHLVLREAFFDVALGGMDLRIGRQILTWGVGDLLFITDVFPKDWTAFFTGMPLEYLKRGVDGARIRWNGSRFGLEAVWIPRATEDRLPGADRFLLPYPLDGSVAFSIAPPPAGLSHSEAGLRAFGRLGRADLTLVAFRGHWRAPALDPSTAQGFYPRLAVYGGSLQAPIRGGILNVEAGYYQSRQDLEGRNPWIPNSQWRALVGYQRQIGPNRILGIQYYGEGWRHHGAYRSSLPPGSPVAGPYRDLLTLRLEQGLRQETLRLEGFLFWSPGDGDGLFQPRVVWRAFDEVTVVLGGNVFWGTASTSLGMMDPNDNLYLWIRWTF